MRAAAGGACASGPRSCSRRSPLTPQELGCAAQLADVGDLLRAGNGAQRQSMVFEANRDLRELMSEIVEHTVPDQS